MAQYANHARKARKGNFVVYEAVDTSFDHISNR
jgi:hypothetical protein